MIKHFSLFSGIESFKKAMTNLGIENELVGYSEFDKYASVALSAIHGVSEDLNYGDITKIDEKEVPDCDLITYGFPCQDISVAGLGKGIIEGETRSGLLYDALRIIKHKMPKYAIAENVKNLVGKRFKDDFNSLLEELNSYGYNNYWQVLNAKDYGIPQNRERVFIVSIRKDVDTGNFEFPEGFDSGLGLKDFLLDEVEDKYYIKNERTQNLISQLKEELEKPCIVASRGRNPNNPSDRTVGSPTEQRLEPNSQRVANTLTTVQKDNLVLEPSNELKLFTNLKGGKWDKIHESARRVYDEEGIAPTIPTCGGGNIEPKVAVRGVTKDTQCGQTTSHKIVVGDDIKPSVAKNFEREKDSIGTSDKEIHQCKCESGWQDNKVGLKVSPTLRAGNHHTSVLDNNYVIRKLTPLECWRLMGFTDEDYWKARKALEKEFYNGGDRSNSQMYKMAGNSIVVDVLEGILESLI